MASKLDQLQDTFSALVKKGTLIDIRHIYMPSTDGGGPLNPLEPVIEIIFDKRQIREETIQSLTQELSYHIHLMDPKAHTSVGYAPGDDSISPRQSKATIRIKQLSGEATKSLNMWMAAIKDELDKQCEINPKQGIFRYHSRLSRAHRKAFTWIFDHIMPPDHAKITQALAEETFTQIDHAIKSDTVDKSLFRDAIANLSALVSTVDHHRDEIQRNSEQPIVENCRKLVEYASKARGQSQAL